MGAMEVLCCWENETIDRELKLFENKVIIQAKSQDIFLAKEESSCVVITNRHVNDRRRIVVAAMACRRDGGMRAIGRSENPTARASFGALSPMEVRFAAGIYFARSQSDYAARGRSTLCGCRSNLTTHQAG